MLSFPYGQAMQRLQPLVLVGEDVYVKTRQERGGATLVTALGVEHPLRRLCSARTLVEHHQRLNWRACRELLHAACARQNASACTDPLGYFLTYLVPAFVARDWTESRLSVAPVSGVMPPDVSAAMEELARHCPFPPVPCPSLWVLGRVWYLAATAPRPGCVHVQYDGTTLGLTGEFMAVKALESTWYEHMHGFVVEAAAPLLQRGKPQSDVVTLRSAQHEVARAGVLQCSDLLFIAGTPPRLGYVLPPHYNRSLHRQSNNDLAMAAPLTLPPTIGGLEAYQRDAAGRWGPARLPHGLCLGPAPVSRMQDAPGLALAAYLRWAAWRVASNSRFHELDT